MQTSNRRFEILPEFPANNSLSNAIKGLDATENVP